MRHIDIGVNDRARLPRPDPYTGRYNSSPGEACGQKTSRADDTIDRVIEDFADWSSGTARIVWHAGRQNELPVTAAHGFCFYEGRILVCNISGRGLTIPGGHIEVGESMSGCLRREALEEACARLSDVRLLGFIEADHRDNAAFDGKYPVRSCQAVFRANVSALGNFSPRHESTDRVFLTVEELPSKHHEWNRVLQAAFQAALEIPVETSVRQGS